MFHSKHIVHLSTVIFLFIYILTGTLFCQPLEQKIDAYLNPILKDDLISGTILIAEKGKIVFGKGYGLENREQATPNTIHTRFRLGSMTKQFTAAGIILLEQMGKLSVNEPLNKFYPDYPNGDKITLHQLLTHTSGIPNFSQGSDSLMFMFYHTIDQVIASFKDKPLTSEPGQKFGYSNAGYIILAGVIEKVSGLSYIEFLRKNFFDPLGMKDTGMETFQKIIPNRATGHVNYGPEVLKVDYRDIPTMSGAGSLYSSPSDMLIWDQALYTDKILLKTSRDKMFTVYKDNYGYGWFVEDRNGHKVIYHAGEISGFIGRIDRYIDDTITVIALFNYESTFARAVIRGLQEIAFGRDPKPLLVLTPPVVDTAILKSYQGAYLASPVDTLYANYDNGKIVFTQTGSSDMYPSLMQTQVLFWVKNMNAFIKFDVAEDGTVKGIIMQNSVQVFRFEKAK